MSESPAVETLETTEVEQSNKNFIYEDRRYVPQKEVIAYILFDVAQTFNINSYSERFNLDVLHISLSLMPIINFFGGIWDAVNDILIGAFVDKTRTRWGKFKPYLVVLAIPATIGTCFFWLMPVFFPTANEMDMVKFFSFFALSVIRETADTFRIVSRTGMLATISPHPVERVRLITLAQVLSLGDNLPELFMSVFVDLINKKVISVSMKSLYVTVGCATAIVSGLMSLYFSVVARERIIQSVEKPSIKNSVKSILNNKPILLITLSEFLGSFSLSTGLRNYYMDVLGNASLYMIVGLPGTFVSTPSYALVPWMRRKFSTRFLWIIGSTWGDFLMFGVFLFGSIGGKKHGFYKRTVPMVIALAIQETLFLVVYGVRRVIPQEMYNEAMDYCEWKNGYRTEAMTGVAKGLASKFVSTFGQTIKTIIMSKIGYDQKAAHMGQSDNTKYYLFAMATGLPLATSLLSLFPKFLYDLSGEKRERMYAELLERREQASRHASCGDEDSIKKLADFQKNATDENNQL
ncbi:MAG: hypothetical protein GX107_05610 [Clostridiales bacterium]|jgi:Na+/melibiose symporter-like transporter|nr:hypothetical protein [Clostridiales bacterium]